MRVECWQIKKTFLPFYFGLHLFIGLPLSILTGIVGGIIDRTTFYLELEMSNWIDEWFDPYRLLR